MSCFHTGRAIAIEFVLVADCWLTLHGVASIARKHEEAAAAEAIATKAAAVSLANIPLVGSNLSWNFKDLFSVDPSTQFRIKIAMAQHLGVAFASVNIKSPFAVPGQHPTLHRRVICYSHAETGGHDDVDRG